LNELNAKHELELKKKHDELSKMPEKSFATVEVSAAAPGFTSSMFSAATVKIDARKVAKQTDKKGYVRLHTNMGDLNIELHCDIVPKTCDNFLQLSETGYYDNTIFHRLIPGFMIQGGDPTGTGKGGKSIWGRHFEDEISNKLQHHGRGILSMANSGKDTNNSQFFITFAPCMHLNFKHTVFGRVVGGNETLAKMERVETDKEEKPMEEIKINKVTIFTNPFTEEKESEEDRKKREAEEKAKDKEDKARGQWYSNPTGSTLKPVKSGVGKYIGAVAPTAPVESTPSGSTKRSLGLDNSTRPAKKSAYGNFDNF